MNSTTQRLNASSHAELDPEQFTAVIDAILDGKYSWACVLLLRFAGHNPLHYIPYRTYNRLLKEDLQKRTVNRRSTPKIEDLPHTEDLSGEDIQGGKRAAPQLLPIWQISRSQFRYM